MYIACSSLCFRRYSLPQALGVIAELQFQKVDLALHEKGAHIRPSEIAADVNRFATMLKATGASFAAFHAQIQAESPESYRDTLRAICRLGRLIAVPLVNIPSAPLGTDLEAEVARLTGLVRLAESEGIILTVETHSQMLTHTPTSAIELCQRVPGLGLTLDPSHYMLHPLHTDEYDEIYPFVKHVRLRDTTPDHLQVRVGQGKIEYGKIINLLARYHYDRALSVDIRDTCEPTEPPEPEVRKLKYLLESMV